MSDNLKKTLRNAKLLENRGDFLAARAIHETIIKKYPKNKHAIRAVARLASVSRNEERMSMESVEEIETKLITLYSSARYNEVIFYGEKINKKLQKSFLIWSILGAAYAAIGELLQAKNAFTNAIKVNPNSAEAINNLAVVLQRLNEYEDAVEHYRRAALLDSSHIESRSNLASLFVEKNFLADAEVIYRQVLRIDPNHTETILKLAILKRRQGKKSISVNLLRKLIVTNPTFCDGFFELASVLQSVGRIDYAVSAYQRGLEIDSSKPQPWFNLGVTLEAGGDFTSAINAYETALSIESSYIEPLNNLAAVHIKLHKYDRATIYCRRAIEISPNDAVLYFNLGCAFHGARNYLEAIAAYKRALKIDAKFFSAYMKLADCLQEANKIKEAIVAYNAALLIDSNSFEAWHNLGRALREDRRFLLARQAYERAVQISPLSVDALLYLAVAHKECGHLDEAIEVLKKVLSLSPNNVLALVSLAAVYQQLRNFDHAVKLYERVLGIDPYNSAACNNLALIYYEQRKLGAAAQLLEKLSLQTPTEAEVFNNLGLVRQAEGKLDLAITAFERALTLRSDYASTEAQLLHLKRSTCDFSVDESIQRALDRLGITSGAVSPFICLSWHDDPASQFIRSKKWSEKNFRVRSELACPNLIGEQRRIKVGLFTADFRNHPGMHLMAGMFEKWDHDKFEFNAFSYGPEREDEMTARVSPLFDNFIRIHNHSDEEVVQLARSLDLDIAIDRNGYTTHSRSSLFSSSLAPVHVNYLGYPSSSGSKNIDFIVADRIVIPNEFRKHYSENIIYMPNSYMPTDNSNIISSRKSTREEFGLPEDAFVLCNFNNSYKISSVEFQIWMRILGKVSNSVIWLLKSNLWVEENLRAEAIKCGIAPERLVFADKVPHAEHLARHSLADLFIDTFNYNAHTTAVDALWAGLPVVTKMGKQFSARVSASLLMAIDLPELICYTAEEYERLILFFAHDADALAAVRSRLWRNRLSKPLFDTDGYTVNFENALYGVHKMVSNGSRNYDYIVDSEEYIKPNYLPYDMFRGYGEEVLHVPLAEGDKGIFIDCGGYDGCSIVKFISQNPSFKAITFEPNELFWPYFDHLPTTLVRKAIAGSSGVRVFTVDSIDGDGSSIIPEKIIDYSGVVENCTFSSYNVDCVGVVDIVQALREFNVLVLKLDVEGAEYEILRALIDSGLMPRISRLYVEWHWKKMGMSYEDHLQMYNEVSKFCDIMDWDALELAVHNKEKEKYTVRLDILKSTIGYDVERYRLNDIAEMFI